MKKRNRGINSSLIEIFGLYTIPQLKGDRMRIQIELLFHIRFLLERVSRQRFNVKICSMKISIAVDCRQNSKALDIFEIFFKLHSFMWQAL